MFLIKKSWKRWAVLSSLAVLFSTSPVWGDDGGAPQGVTEAEIRIGHLGPQTGPVAAYDKIRMGIQAYFNYVNERGGVKGRKLRLIAYDDQYQPGRTVQLTKRLVDEDKVYAMLGNVCTPCNVATRPFNERSGIPMLMTSSGSKQFVEPPIANYMGSSLANYEFEARVLTDYIATKLKAKRVVVAYQNDDYGSPLAEAAKDALKGYAEVELVGEVNFQAADSDLSTQAQRIRQANPDAILAFSTPAPAAQLKKALYNIGLSEPAFLVSSVGGDSETMFDLAGKEVWNGTISSAVLPKPDQSEDESIKQYIEQFAKDYPKVALADWGQTGWAAAEVLVEALKRSKTLSWDDFLSVFDSFDNWTGSMYAGVSFSEENHYGLTSMFITEAKDGHIVPISQPITFDPVTGKISGG
ncbi:extracellular ligand-binding receptor [Alcanivorax balearicus MACL04]|uniref:Extracellular ligand-binding receptor n=1 Tax=Alloalcanivorax balearicus MACL04 TaxID=1177182 RepID=A0ABT2QVY5_9GAMM|nr:ABC transporter substrate-binding protein [Alloalcanivorax balearicus]MCU5781684.1 extracellular ligand-binding receptor [Alloalcanivorax balearicus MACL04]